MAYNDNKGGYGRGPKQGEGRGPSFKQGERAPRKYDGGKTAGDDKPRRYNDSGKAPYRKPDGDKPYRKFDNERSGDDKPRRHNDSGKAPYRKPDGDRPYKRFDNERGGDRPYKKFDGERSGDDKPRRYNDSGKAPYRKPEGDRPYKKFDNERGGDKPCKKFDNERGGDKPYKKFDNERGGDRPYKKFDNDRGGDRPYKKFDNDRGGDKPYKKFDNERGGDTQYKKFDDRREDALPADTNAADELPYIVMGRNAVREAVKSGRSIDRILVQKEPDGSLREIIGMAKDAKVQVREVDRFKLDEICMPFGHGGKPGNHQGILAQVPGVEYCELSDILDVAKSRGEKPFIILLDGIEDPHNLGSIIRSADCAGAHGVIIPKRRSASVTAAACKASAGAVEYVKVARVSNLAGAMERLKDEGIWMAAADMGGVPMEKAKLTGAIGLVIGSEGSGVSRLIKEKCDFTVSVPICGHIDSLNAAVAAAILMFEKKRQG